MGKTIRDVRNPAPETHPQPEADEAQPQAGKHEIIDKF